MGGLTRKRLCLLFSAGALLLIVGGVLIPVVDLIVRNKIKETVVISNTSDVYEIWSEFPIPIYMQFYMFNLSNPEEVKAGKKPVVVQSGPYTYQEKRKKYDIVFNENGTVTYRQRRTFFFLRNMSVGADTDLFTTVNPPVLAVISALHHAPLSLRGAINTALKLYGEDIFMTRPVKEILWGYTDPALKTLKGLFPDWFYTDFVGYFINKNDTDDGLYTVFTGSNDVGNLGVINKYNGSDYLPYWSTPWANMINGSDGTISPPFEQDTEQLPMFSSDICRSIFGVFQKTVTTKRDISLRRYVGSQSELANATVNPDNAGFCTPKGSCLPSGLLNISNCQLVDYFHIPVVVSFPHFLMADPRIISSIGGMHPVPEEHEVAVDVEPWTGLVLQAFKRLQINMYITKVEGMSLTENVRTVYMPIFWLNESAVVNDKYANMLHRQLFAPMEITSVLEKVLMAVGGAFILLVIAVVWRRNLKAEPRTLPPGPVPTISNNGTRRSARRRPQDRERVPLLRDASAPNPSPSVKLQRPPPVSPNDDISAGPDPVEPTY